MLQKIPNCEDSTIILKICQSRSGLIKIFSNSGEYRKKKKEKFIKKFLEDFYVKIDNLILKKNQISENTLSSNICKEINEYKELFDSYKEDIEKKEYEENNECLIRKEELNKKISEIQSAIYEKRHHLIKNNRGTNEEILDINERILVLEKKKNDQTLLVRISLSQIIKAMKIMVTSNHNYNRSSEYMQYMNERIISLLHSIQNVCN